MKRIQDKTGLRKALTDKRYQDNFIMIDKNGEWGIYEEYQEEWIDNRKDKEISRISEMPKGRELTGLFVNIEERLNWMADKAKEDNNMETTYTVATTHEMSEKHSGVHEIKVSKSGDENKPYNAHGSVSGYGKAYKTENAAIKGLLVASGTKIVKIEEIKKEDNNISKFKIYECPRGCGLSGKEICPICLNDTKLVNSLNMDQRIN